MTPIEFGLKPVLQKAPLTGLTLFVVIIACWGFFLRGAGTGMNIWNMSTMGFPPTAQSSQMMAGTPSTGIMSMVFMWWTMMIAMMMPSVFRHLPVYRLGAYSPAAILSQFLVSYVGIWLLFSVAATALQFLVVEFGLLHGMKMWSSNTWFSCGLLTFAGLYQFTNMKINSLLICQNAFTGQRPIKSGAIYGLNCLMSSFPLMLLLFVGGVMNLYWVVALSVLVTIEKTLPQPKPFSLAIGFGCLCAAAWMLIR